MKAKYQFEIRRLNGLDRIVKVYEPVTHQMINSETNEVSDDFVEKREEIICDIPFSKDSENYAKVICHALNAIRIPYRNLTPQQNEQRENRRRRKHEIT